MLLTLNSENQGWQEQMITKGGIRRRFSYPKQSFQPFTDILTHNVKMRTNLKTQSINVASVGQH